MKRYINIVTALVVLIIITFGFYVRYSVNIEQKIRIAFISKKYVFEDKLNLNVNDSIIIIDSKKRAEEIVNSLINIDSKYKFAELNSNRFKISNNFCTIVFNYNWNRGGQLIFNQVDISACNKEYCQF
jgi:hypothetical protein